MKYKTKNKGSGFRVQGSVFPCFFLYPKPHTLNPSQGGYAMIIAVMFFLFVSGIIVFNAASSGLNEVKTANDLARTKESYFLSEAGVEDVSYRIKNSLPVSSSESLSLNNYTVTTNVTDITGGKDVVAEADRDNLRRKVKVKLLSGDGVTFHYGVQTGEGGVQFNGSSSIKGNLYSNGPVTGTDNYVYGDIVSAGPAGNVSNMRATSSIYAHTISGSTADKDVYYQSASNVRASGSVCPNSHCHLGSTDQATSSLPISDDQIAEWENDAAAGGVIGSPCPYTITTNVTLGPKKINCNLTVSHSGTLNLTGPIWVVGNINFDNTNVKVDPSVGNKSVAIIADNPANRLSSSQISVSQSTEFFGSGGANSYVLLISQNRDAEEGGSNIATDIANSTNGKLLLYAGHGLINLANNVNLKEVTAWKIQLNNSAQVIYETGLANLLFSSGPASGYSIGGWNEVE